MLGRTLMKSGSLRAGLAVAAALLLAAAAPAQPSQSDRETVEALSAHFAAVPTMTGEFLQFGPNGDQTAGVFYISRPGKIRFNYEKPAALEVISNGKTVAVHNRRLKTWDFYPLDKTPLNLLLADKVQFDDKTIRNVVNEPDLTTVVMAGDKVLGNTLLTLMFDPESFDLRQWTIRDAKGAETSVMIFNVQKNVEISEKFFEFDEREIRRRQQDGSR
jgi:outer membrane lipoprotein-sorting protein